MRSEEVRCTTAHSRCAINGSYFPGKSPKQSIHSVLGSDDNHGESNIHATYTAARTWCQVLHTHCLAWSLPFRRRVPLVSLEEETGGQKQSHWPTVLTAVQSRAGTGAAQWAPEPTLPSTAPRHTLMSDRPLHPWPSECRVPRIPS